MPLPYIPPIMNAMGSKSATQQVAPTQPTPSINARNMGGTTDYHNPMGDQGLTQGARDRIERRHQEEYLINQ